MLPKAKSDPNKAETVKGVDATAGEGTDRTLLCAECVAMRVVPEKRSISSARSQHFTEADLTCLASCKKLAYISE